MNDVLEAARRDVANGRAWKAMDRLNGLLTVRVDDEVLDAMARVAFDMGDHPCAGGLWWVLGRDDEDARVAIAAWRERHGNAAAQFRSLPRQVRDVYPSAAQSLRGAAEGSKQPIAPAADERRGLSGFFEDLGFAATLLGFVALALVGLGTVMRWIWG